MSSARWVRTAGVFVVVFLGYLAGALLSLKAFGASELGPAFFPPAGVTVAAMLASPRTRWPVVVAAIACAEGAVDLHAGYAASATAGYILANSVEPILGASLVLARCRGVPDLRRRRDLFLFVAGACVAGPLLGGIVGGASVAWHHGAWWPGAAMRWFASDAIGVLVVAAPILLWPRQSRILRERPVESAGILGATAAMSWLSVWTGLQPSLLILPVLAWAALRLDVLGASLAGASAAFAANLRAASGLSLFEDMDLSAAGRLAFIQGLIAVNVLLAMLIAQEGAARREAARERELEGRERQRLQTLARLAQELSAALTPQDVAQVVQQHLTDDIDATTVSLGLLSPNGSNLDWVAAEGLGGGLSGSIALSEPSVATDAARTGRPVLVPSVQDSLHRHGADPSMLRSDTASVAAWPLSWRSSSVLLGSRVIGTLLLQWAKPQPLNEAQQAFISAVATAVSQALMRAKSYADEHARAVVLHHAAHPIAPIAAQGLDYRGLYRPAGRADGLGGDWYNVMPLPDGRTYLAVGDVVGHGLTAVQDMTQLRGTGNAYAYQGLGPAEILSQLNRFAASQITGDFATTFVAVFDDQTHSLSYSSAGHPPALLRRADTGEMLRLADARGPVLGPFEDAGYAEGTVHVRPGDVLVIYSDGLLEHDYLTAGTGIAHLERVVADWPPDSLLDCEALADELTPAPSDDDVCLLVARFGPAR